MEETKKNQMEILEVKKITNPPPKKSIMGLQQNGRDEGKNQ